MTTPRLVLTILFLVLLMPLGLVAQSEDDDVGGRPVSGDCENGYGVMEWRNGARYQGTFRSGRPHGKGEYRYADGSRYLGEFRNGRRHGTGTYTWPSGAVYKGEFRNGQRHDGEMRYSDGRRFSGDFRDNQPAKGRMRFPDGREYRGSYRDGQPHGRGKMKNKDMTTIEGEFINGAPTAGVKRGYDSDFLLLAVGGGFQIRPTNVLDSSGGTFSNLLDTWNMSFDVRIYPFNEHWFGGIKVLFGEFLGATAGDSSASIGASVELSFNVGYRAYLSYRFHLSPCLGVLYNGRYGDLSLQAGLRVEFLPGDRFLGGYLEGVFLFSGNEAIDTLNPGLSWIEGRFSAGILVGL